MEEKSDVSFLQEIEDRLNYIFGETKARQEPGGTAESGITGPEEIKTEQKPAVESTGKQEDAGASRRDAGYSGSIHISPLKDLKMIVLSLEWEISDENLERFDDEVLRLEGVYSDNMAPLAFMRIMRFLGRYLRMKGAESEPGSINLLLLTYDNLEAVLLSKSMSESEKFSLMRENIVKYRSWVDGIDMSMTAGQETEPPRKEPVFTDILAFPLSEPEVEENGGEILGSPAQAEEMTDETKDEIGEIIVDPTLNAEMASPASEAGQPAERDEVVSPAFQAEMETPVPDSDVPGEMAGEDAKLREGAQPTATEFREFPPETQANEISVNALSSAEPVGAKKEIPESATAVPIAGAVTQAELARAMEEVRLMIREEIKALREELRSMHGKM